MRVRGGGGGAAPKGGVAVAGAASGGEAESRSAAVMAASGEITTLPSSPADGGSSSFPPGNFKEPKRLYCKNGGYFLRINPDGRVDGIREKSDPYIRLQLQATAVGEVVIKGLSANRYLAMTSDGRLLGARRTTDECYFLERLEANNYNTYRSRKYPDWFSAPVPHGNFVEKSQTQTSETTWKYNIKPEILLNLLSILATTSYSDQAFNEVTAT